MTRKIIKLFDGDGQNYIVGDNGIVDIVESTFHEDASVARTSYRMYVAPLPCFHIFRAGSDGKPFLWKKLYLNRATLEYTENEE